MVVAVGGSDGGLSFGDANGEVLAPHCVAVLGLAYFKADGLPSTLDAIPLIIHWFQVQVLVGPPPRMRRSTDRLGSGPESPLQGPLHAG